MKKFKYLLAAVCVIVAASCTKQDIQPFGEVSYVYFDKFWKDAPAPGTEKADTTRVTFFFADDQDDYVLADLRVILAGKKPERDLKFKLKTVDKFTTAKPDEYILDDEYLFRAKPLADDATVIDDTIQIKIKRSARLEQEGFGYKLGLEIVPTEDLQVGQYERSIAMLYITKDPVKPTWWTREVDETLMGYYSPKKYKLFLVNIPGAEELNGEMIASRPDKARKLVFEFKKWLNDNPTIDDLTGQVMTVNI